MKQQPIGVFDSGLGGLSIANAIHAKLSNEDLIYIADSQFAPYGDKDLEFISSRAEVIVNKLIELKVKAIVVACNTATVNIISRLRARFSLPIIGIEPGVKPAVEATSSGHIGVLATQNTIQSESFKKLVSRFSSQTNVISQACPEFVHIVEHNLIGTGLALQTAKQYVEPLIEQGCDQIVLGCTHFPFLTNEIKKVCQDKANIIDTSDAVAKQLNRVLLEQDLLSDNKNTGTIDFYSTKQEVHAAPLLELLWPTHIKSKFVTL